MNIYGAAQEEHKNDFLAELALFRNNMTEPYIVGDFNIVRYAYEKKEKVGVHRHIALFNSVGVSYARLE